jgi:hypothetical protein
MDGIVEHKEEHRLKEGETSPEFNLADPRKQLERGLKSRHIQFLALGMTLNSHFQLCKVDTMQVVQLEQDYLSVLVASTPKQVLHHCSWAISP